MSVLSKLQANALKTGKLSSKVAFIRATLNEGREDESILTDDLIGDTIKKMPGNIGDDEYVQSVIAVLAQIENPTEELKQKAGLPSVAAAEQEPQTVLAIKCGKVWDVALIDTMQEDIEAGKQAKAIPFHTLDNLIRLFGDAAPSNEYKNLMSKWPIVDSEDTKEHPMVARFDDDKPAKYKHFNVTTSKYEDRDFYFLQFDYSPLGVKINAEIDEIDKVTNKNTDAKDPWLTMSDYDRVARRKELVSDKNEGRKALKRAVKVYHQVAAVNGCHKLVAKLRRDDNGNIKRQDPIFIYEKDDPTKAKAVDMNTFLSYVPAKVDAENASLADLVKTKPVKAPSGKNKQTGGAPAADPKVPVTPHVAESYLAMIGQYMDDKANQAALFREGSKNKQLMNTMILVHDFLHPFAQKHRTENEANIKTQDEGTRDVA